MGKKTRNFKIRVKGWIFRRLIDSIKLMNMGGQNFSCRSYKSDFLRKFPVIWLYTVAAGCGCLMTNMGRKLSLMMWFLILVKPAPGCAHTSKLHLLGTWSMIFAKKWAIFGQILEINAHFLFIKRPKTSEYRNKGFKKSF